MKLKEFLDMTPGTKVIIKKRRARLEGRTHIGDCGSTLSRHGINTEYGWAFFRYSDTGRRVTKRHRQVEKEGKS